ncbi:MAG TPA: SIS domain-containing protein [Candidatus Tumulicola sp.]
MLTEPDRQSQIADWVAERFAARSAPADAFFEREALPLARAARLLFQRFERGGRLMAIGRGPYATDAQHLSVEFVHPVIVGKRALPAMDLSFAYERWVDAVVRPDDIVVGLGPPEGDASVQATLDRARQRGALTVAFPGERGDYAVAAPSGDPHLHQELFEILGHALYESVHVFFEHREIPNADGGAAAFLYPFLGRTERPPDEVLDRDVADSILAKGRDARALREATASEMRATIAQTILELRQRIDGGAKILAFGNGGSATDATDFALDCVMPENDWPSIPALSLSLEPAILTAVSNDVGVEVVFVRQIIAQGRAGDVAIAFSTSGGSRNVIAGLEEARRRGMMTVALLGYDGGEIVRRGLADRAIVVRSDYIPRIQEVQGTIYHILREGLAMESAA